ncbi:Crp/Fnr family transcriptional regulator [Piscinibacter sp.]|uniref:Crp/Fnr family transcriptional regulator n=1 Tax=Piscinibacter sp. TaxID=1903157 RepID=UPI002B8594FD|nr:cyclic nucleotide-binding domain-containing protein [Albitalea sp.]HUG26034.1 cyclic nucleotide-binding domain-containing protein [Albitalea sp.]
MEALRLELLQGMPIFGGVGEPALAFLLERAQSVGVPAGEFYFHEGDEASGMFVLETGHVVVSKTWKGKEFVLRHLGPGDCFGEMALMDLQPRSASVRAIDDCNAIELSPGHLYDLYKRDAEQFALIQMNMGREVCRRLRATDEMLFHAEMGSTPTDPSQVHHST